MSEQKVSVSVEERIIIKRIRVVPGWVKGAAPDMKGKDGEKHHVHSALIPSFLALSRMGNKGVSKKISYALLLKWPL